MKALLIIVALGCLAGAIYFFSKSSSTSKTTTTSTQQKSNNGLSGLLSGLNLSGLKLSII